MINCLSEAAAFLDVKNELVSFATDEWLAGNSMPCMASQWLSIRRTKWLREIIPHQPKALKPHRLHHLILTHCLRRNDCILKHQLAT